MPEQQQNLAHNLRRIAHLDLPGGGQVVVQDGYAYIGHMKPPHGTTIVDVRDPGKPRVVASIDVPDDFSHTHKVRVVGDLMYVNVEQNNRHYLRKGARLPGLREAWRRQHDSAPSDEHLAAELGLTPADIAVLDTANARGYEDGGFRIYDIADRANPKLITHHRTHGFGTHRFDADENYAYISTEMEGYIGNILVIYDVADPSRPQEVSRWWMPGQHLAGGETPTWKGYGNRLHHAMRVGNELWASVWHAGFRVLDVSDINAPRVIGSHNYHPPFPEPTHTVMPVEVPLAGRRVAVAVDEEHEHRRGRLHGFMWVFDITDMDNIHALSAYDVSEMDSPWSRAAGRFGAHQYRERLDGPLVYVTWFSGGLRIVDISDPLQPQESAFFIPEPIGGNPSPQSNDVDVDAAGLIYLLDRNRGFDILEYTPHA